MATLFRDELTTYDKCRHVKSFPSYHCKNEWNPGQEQQFYHIKFMGKIKVLCYLLLIPIQSTIRLLVCYISGANSVSLCHYVIQFNDLYTFSKSTYMDHQVELMKLLIFPLLSSYLNFNGAKLMWERDPQLQTFVVLLDPVQSLQPHHVAYTVGQHFFSFFKLLTLG